MKALTSLLLAFFVAGQLCYAAETNLVANGSFELSQRKPGAPDDWAAAGNASVVQQLMLDTGRDGQRCAKLACTAFDGDGPDFHAMLCQVGKVSVRRGQWYRLAFWAKVRSFEGADRAVVRVSPDGVKTAEVLTLTPTQSDNAYHLYEVDLSAFAMTSQFQISLAAEIDNVGDQLFLDDIEVVGILAAGHQPGL